MADTDSPLSKIPQVDAVLCSEECKPLLERYPRRLIADCIRDAADALRGEFKTGGAFSGEMAEFIPLVEQGLAAWSSKRTRRAVNATGIILHTNLGRAALSSQAVDALLAEASGYTQLEIETGTGKRGRRGKHVEDLLVMLTGAEAALVVNNNAAATMLVLSTLAQGMEVIISRGQLIEIGGSFRLPEIMKASGAQLIEVGTTNRTYIKDYEAAITEKTALITRVHTSNYALVGFSTQASLEELINLGKEKGLPVFDDLGSGALVDLSKIGTEPGVPGLGKEPLVKESVAAGASVVTFSTDKLIGGPQGGAIVGERELVQKLREHPLARAFRVGKMTLAALESTLELYLDEEKAFDNITVLKMLKAPAEEVRRRAEALKSSIGTLTGAVISVEEEFSELGGGALPAERIPTWVVAISPETFGSDELIARLRSGIPPVFGRIKSNKVLLDPRTLLDGEDDIVASRVREAFQS